MITSELIGQFNQQGGIQSFGADANLLVHFEERLVEKKVKPEGSEEAVTVLEKAEFVVITMHGGDSSIHKITNENRKKFCEIRFPSQYAKFKDGLKKEDQYQIGTPVSALIKDEALAETLKINGVFNLEQFSQAGDNLLKAIPNGYELRKEAEKLLSQTKDSSTIEELKAQIASLSAKIQAKDEVIVEPVVEQEVLEDDKPVKPKSNKKA
jgi:hypothetical protein